MSFDILGYIGRFQGFHYGHKAVVKEGISRLNPGGKLLMFLGSANQPRTIKNPLTFTERAQIIKKSMGDLSNQIIFRPVFDYKYDEDWVLDVKRQMEIALDTFGYDHEEANIGLIGMNKDESTYYLKHFPFWPYVDFPRPDDSDMISATTIRQWLFDKDSINFSIDSMIDNDVKQELIKFRDTDHFNMLKATQ